jgi:uncharacterized Zn-finger protein
MLDSLAQGLGVWEDEGGPAAPVPAAPAALPGQAGRAGVPRYANDIGALRIGVGVGALNCIGATPPADHPHVYLSLAGAPGLLCPYCATFFYRDAALGGDETVPAGCFYDAGAGAPHLARIDPGDAP